MPFSPEGILFVVFIVCVGRVFLFVILYPIFIIVFVVVAVGIRIRGGVNDVLRVHQFRFINLKVSEI